LYGHQETWEDAIKEQATNKQLAREEVLHQFGVQTPRGSWRRSNP